MLKRKYFDEGEKDEDDMSIYSKQLRESLLEDDELSSWEEGFMNGYEESI
ncbi:hypothetical protein HY637_05020 [Candidatus Woesearchaeota archaeon]|nr:hypothetical protein [Candidatus Woesearchaeota archaeon]